MSGRLVLPPLVQASSPHECDQPRLSGTLAELGALWQCDCGRYWLGVQHGNLKVAAWTPISARRARRCIRERGGIA